MGMTITGVRSAANHLRAIGARAGDLRPVWPAVGSDIADNMVKQFATEGGHGGKPWAPLSPDYLQWKVSHGHPSQKLVLSGEMRGKVTSKPMDIEDHAAKYAEFGLRDEKAIYHHYGTRFMPQRRFLWAFPQMESDINDRLRAWIVDGRSR